MNNNTFWAALSIVIISWFFYWVIAPKSWKEWARAGMVQAFVIAFYAEMFGFPITVYALTRVFGIDVSATFWDGNLWVHLTGTPSAMLVSMILGYAIAFLGIVLLTAGWRQVYRARREHRLAKDGPYAVVRHPQYTGIFLVIFGEGIVHWPTVFSLLAVPLLVTAYVLLARKEEQQMVAAFGDDYLKYRRQVPMFFPRWGQWHCLLRFSRSPGT